jgi:hypothetical protein
MNTETAITIPAEKEMTTNNLVESIDLAWTSHGRSQATGPNQIGRRSGTFLLTFILFIQSQ